MSVKVQSGFKADDGKPFQDKIVNKIHSRDLPSHTKLKYRQPGQNNAEDVKNKDFKRDLKERLKIMAAPHDPDADDKVDDDDESDEDDTEELLAELNRIKKERAAEEARKEAEKRQQEEKIRMENILRGNPLLNSNKTEFKVKRRWDDDVVFKNCARNESTNKNKEFINDTLRSEFHKKFMEKCIE